MENEEIRQYLINFVEKTLNECEAFTRVYGKDFVRKRLAINLEKVYIDIANSNVNTARYDMENSCITFFLSNDSIKTLTIADIESNRKLQHMILHESIHAIFKRTKEECKAFGIENGTGTLEFYNNGQELGRGLNEGLTEWICQKAGYGALSYVAEQNIIKILELAIGENAVMQFAKGHIKENIAQLLQMTEDESRYTLSLVDKICENENRLYMKYNTIEDIEDERLDKSISHFEATIFEKYFKDEIETAQNAESISEETMQRLYNLSFCIKGGKTPESEIFNSRLPLKFKDEIYPRLLEKRHEADIAQIRKSRQEKSKHEEITLPVIYKKSWFQRLKEAIKKKFTKEQNHDVKINIPTNEDKTSIQQQFREYISDMSNYAEEYVGNQKRELQKKNELRDAR